MAVAQITGAGQSPLAELVAALQTATSAATAATAAATAATAALATIDGGTP